MTAFKKRIITTMALCLGLCLTSCELFETHPYDVHISGKRNLTATNTAMIEKAMEGRTAMRFAMLSDTQASYDETVDAVKAINAEGVDFVLHGGDLTDYGATREFILQRDILLRLAVPWVTVIGNHDCLATGEQAYLSIFGPLNYSFRAGNTLFVCLNTNALEYDYSVPVPDFGFMEELLTHLPEGVTRTVFLMHVRPFETVFNNNVARVFERYVNAFPGVAFCLYGHEHRFAADDLFGDGVMYYQCPDIAKREYLLFNLNADGTYSYERRSF